MSRSSFVKPLPELATVAAAIAAIRPVGAVGVDIASWKVGGFSTPYALVQIAGDQAIALTSPTGGANGPELWGKFNGRWCLLMYLNKGANINVITNALDYIEEITHAAMCTHLYVAATKDGGSPTQSFVPVETWGAP